MSVRAIGYVDVHLQLALSVLWVVIELGSGCLCCLICVCRFYCYIVGCDLCLAMLIYVLAFVSVGLAVLC